MVASQISLSWEPYQNNIFTGFSELQQNQEFVDMTLAAGGSLVKVHRNIVALASPYIKEMIKSASCQHPVIFLNDVTHDVLSYILEYIYTGEVKVPADILNRFTKAAEALHISGINMASMAINDTQPIVAKDIPLPAPDPFPGQSNIAASIVINNQDNNDYNLEVKTFPENVPNYYMNNNENAVPNGESIPYNEGDDKMINIIRTNETEVPSVSTPRVIDLQNCKIIQKDDIALHKVQSDFAQYSISNRGCLQLILNRFIYYAHHKAFGGKKCRWRCLEYRRQRCKAYVDTNRHTIVARKFEHSHGFHDKKIQLKIDENKIFSSVKEAEDKLALQDTPALLDLPQEISD